jgi:hypothetical protein
VKRDKRDWRDVALVAAMLLIIAGAGVVLVLSAAGK